MPAVLEGGRKLSVKAAMHDATEMASVVAIVPAAGRSGRMGTPKQLLRVDGKPMLLGIVDVLLDGGVSWVTVVASNPLCEQLPSLPSRVGLVLNEDPRTEMIDSIRIGLASSPGADGYLVCPSDAARIAAADVRRCVEAFSRSRDSIVIATHNGRGGHPVIIPASLRDAVQSPECDAGLNHLARNRPGRVRTVACDSPGTITNVNTPADFEKLAGD
jgi:molybdenum cofactor cytidylyltransferase